MSLPLSVRILLFGLVKTHKVLLSNYVIQVGRHNIYKWKRLPVTVKIQVVQISISHVVSPRFFRCTLIVSCFKPVTELFYKIDTRESAR